MKRRAPRPRFLVSPNREQVTPKCPFRLTKTRPLWATHLLTAREQVRTGENRLEHPVTFHRGESADVEPAVSGWRVAVDSTSSKPRRAEKAQKYGWHNDPAKVRLTR